MTIRSSSMSRPMGTVRPANTNAGPPGHPPSTYGPANPRITRKPASGGSGGSRGSKILIGVVLALAIIVGLFFCLSLIHHRSDVVRPARLPVRGLDPARGENRSVGSYALLMALTGFVSAWLAIRVTP